MILEVCAYNIQSCIVAEKAGAKRIELCADPAQGGTTPSYGLVSYAVEHLSITIFPMIRPRGGNFVFDDDELEIMRRDILTYKALGCTGIASGVQTAERKINTEHLKRIVEWAHPMEVTCHKVFDRAPDAFEALEDVINSGCKRILTSGLQATATEGGTLLAQLVARAAGRIIIMPGGGVRSSNISQLAEKTGATEYHSSALLPDSKDYIADKDEVRMLVENLKR